MNQGCSYGTYGEVTTVGDTRMVDLHSVDLRATFRDHIYGCFIEDTHAMHNLAAIGEDDVMVETDYPHSDSTWPNSIKIARDQMAHLPKPPSTSCCAATPNSSGSTRRSPRGDRPLTLVGPGRRRAARLPGDQAHRGRQRMRLPGGRGADHATARPAKGRSRP
ncbi:hypothetical protein OG216_01940 [Streptomycetaceae bacterium NBC_01309]